MLKKMRYLLSKNLFFIMYIWWFVSIFLQNFSSWYSESKLVFFACVSKWPIDHHRGLLSIVHPFKHFEWLPSKELSILPQLCMRIYILYFLGIGCVYTKYRKNFTYLVNIIVKKFNFYLSFKKIVGQEKHELENLMRQWTS